MAEALHQLRLVVWPGRHWVLRVSVIVLTALVVVMAVILVVDVSMRVAVEELVGRR